MLMDSQQVINIVLGLTMTIIGWLAREMWAAVKELKSDLSTLREDLPRQYTRREDYREDIKELKDLLNKFFDRLEAKQDK